MWWLGGFAKHSWPTRKRTRGLQDTARPVGAAKSPGRGGEVLEGTGKNWPKGSLFYLRIIQGRALGGTPGFKFQLKSRAAGDQLAILFLTYPVSAQGPTHGSSYVWGKNRCH